jgi:hypothetical protein
MVGGRHGGGAKGNGANVDSNRAQRNRLERFSRIVIKVPDADLLDLPVRHAPPSLPEVTSLVFTAYDGARPDELDIHPRSAAWLGSAFPNLRNLELRQCKYCDLLDLEAFATTCPRLASVTWHSMECYAGSFDCIRNLKVLDMDEAFFYEDTANEIFSNLGALERVSFKNVRFGLLSRWPHTSFVPPPQPWLVRFVREAPNLRWFRSDLTPENVALLVQERPDVTFAP